MKRVSLVTIVICLLLSISSYAYTYKEVVDEETGIRTFYMVLDDTEVYHASEQTKAIQIAEGSESAQKIEETKPVEIVEEAKAVYGDIVLSEDDAYALRWVLCLEEEGFEEECRVCEAIFNRVLSEKNWGNTVGEVLAKKGQFSTYKLIGSKRAWDSPGEVEDDVISEVLRETSTRLPSLRYVYFDSKGGVNGKDHVKYGGTTYGRE